MGETFGGTTTIASRHSGGSDGMSLSGTVPFSMGATTVNSEFSSGGTIPQISDMGPPGIAPVSMDPKIEAGSMTLSGHDYFSPPSLQTNEFQPLKPSNIPTFDTVKPAIQEQMESVAPTVPENFVPSFEDTTQIIPQSTQELVKPVPIPLEYNEFMGVAPFIPSFERNDENGKLTLESSLTPASDVNIVEKPVDLLQNHYIEEQAWTSDEQVALLPDLEAQFEPISELSEPNDLISTTSREDLLVLASEPSELQEDAIERLAELPDGDLELQTLVEIGNAETSKLAKEVLVRRGIVMDAVGILADENTDELTKKAVVNELELQCEKQVLKEKDIRAIVNRLTNQALSGVQGRENRTELEEEMKRRLLKVSKELKEIINPEAIFIKELKKFNEETKRLELLHLVTVRFEIIPGTIDEMERDRLRKQGEIEEILDRDGINGLAGVMALDYVIDATSQELQSSTETKMEISNV